ncbi:Ribosomal protein S18 [Rickettsiales bacterium Ac37b]|nr:Ribosomal protein S18 [Rickettsiales bacterium Ac37b]
MSKTRHGSNDQDKIKMVSPTQVFFKRKKRCPLSEEGSPKVDYKNVKLLSRFISERGRILPSRITSVSAKKQRELKIAIKRARSLALLPYAQK